MVKVNINMDNVLYVQKYDGSFEMALDMKNHLDNLPDVRVVTFCYEGGINDHISLTLHSEKAEDSILKGYMLRKDDVFVIYHNNGMIHATTFYGKHFDLIFTSIKVTGSVIGKETKE